jgi:hypothetical protein
MTPVALVRLGVAGAFGTVLSAAAFAAPLFVSDLDRTIADPAQNPFGVSVVETTSGSAAASAQWRHGPLLGFPFTENRDTRRAPIAVANDRVDVAGPYGHGYSLDGSGASSSFCATCNYVASALDGATDGTYNYTVVSASSGSSAVWRTDRQWDQASWLFDLTMVAAGEQASGITFDPERGSLWVVAGPASGGGARILELALDGTLRSQFGLLGLGLGVLAMDYGDDSLWWLMLGDLDPASANTVVRFDRNGQLLSSIPYGADWSFRPILGAEFELPPAQVPEPSTRGLLALALVGVVATCSFSRGPGANRQASQSGTA